MSATTDRRMVENEMIFRRRNETVKRDHDSFIEPTKKRHNLTDYEDTNIDLDFYCECSDENCTKRIPMQLATYADIHKNRNQFIIINGHQVSLIERVVAFQDGYSIVQKFDLPKSAPLELNTTDIHNT